MAEIKVLMAGGRRCGKTTLLAIMRKYFNEVLHHGPEEGPDLLRLNADGRIITFDQALEAINCYFNDNFNALDEFAVDDLPDAHTSTITLPLQAIANNSRLDITFRDLPGEWFSESGGQNGDSQLPNEDSQGLNDDFQGQNIRKEDIPRFIKEWIQESNVIVLAVDTPSIMEELTTDQDGLEGVGHFAEYFNRIRHITEHLKEALTGQIMLTPSARKMILIVPMKCEKYIINQDSGDLLVRGDAKKRVGMEYVNKKVKAAYHDLISTFTSDLYRDKITLAITPISTVKEFCWHRFAAVRNGEAEQSIYDANGNAVRYELRFDAMNHPYSVYGFRSPAAFDYAINHGPGSELCEQILIYILVYIFRFNLRFSAANLPQRGPLGRLIAAIINFFQNNTAFQNELVRLQTRKMKRGHGFEIIQNPLGI